jgi:hypothetical protein
MDRYAKFYIVFNETLTSPSMNLSLTDLKISISVSRLSSPLVPGIDFNWTVLNYTDRWIHVKLGFSEPLSVT